MRAKIFSARIVTQTKRAFYRNRGYYKGDGFRSDGSYRYGRIIEETDMAPRVQQQIQDTLSAMKYGRYASFMTTAMKKII